MSILDFARHLGRQVFDRDDVAADKIKEQLEITLSGIKNLDVQYDDGVVTLCGDCVAKGDRAQAITIAGNIKGVKRVIADQLNAPPTPPEEPEEKEEFYEIKKGDTLGAIAKHYYGKASAYKRIFEANRGVIDDPDKIYPGQKIRIPLD
jgi:LysM repeat protein